MEVSQVAGKNLKYPTESWERSSPEQQGLDSDSLDSALACLEANFKNYYSYVVVKNGCLVFEASNKRPYEDPVSKWLKAFLRALAKLFDKPQATFVDRYPGLYNMRSATKSIVSILVGIAIDKGLIKSIDDSMLDYLPPDDSAAIDPNMKKITIRHLLTMKSGIPSIEGGLNAYKLVFGDGDWVRFILKLGLEAEPGEKFVYNSANTHLLSAVLANAAKMSTLEFAKRTLFEPLGITNVLWEEDKRGYNFGGGNLYLSTHDLARIGLLYLNNGVWDQKEIVSKQWVEQTLESRHEWMYGFHYGFLWYSKNEKCVKTGKEVMTYSASGAGGQKIQIIPEMNIVIAAASRSSLLKDRSYFLDSVIGEYILSAEKPV